MLKQLIELAEDREARSEDEASHTAVFISPPSDRKSDRFTYRAFDSFGSAVPFSEGVIYTFDFDKEKELQILSENQASFGVEMIVLKDHPGADYSVGFEMATSGLKSISYSDVISRVDSAAENKVVDLLETASRHDREMAFAGGVKPKKVIAAEDAASEQSEPSPMPTSADPIGLVPDSELE